MVWSLKVHEMIKWLSYGVNWDLDISDGFFYHVGKTLVILIRLYTINWQLLLSVQLCMAIGLITSWDRKRAAVYRSTQPCVPAGSLHRVPAPAGVRRESHRSAAGWQVTLCNPIWHVISRSGEVILITNCYIRVCFTFLYCLHYCLRSYKVLKVRYLSPRQLLLAMMFRELMTPHAKAISIFCVVVGLWTENSAGIQPAVSLYQQYSLIGMWRH